MNTFKNFCAWGLIWFFFIAAPVLFIRAEWGKMISVNYQLNVSLEKACAFKTIGGRHNDLELCLAKFSKKILNVVDPESMTAEEVQAHLDAEFGIVRDKK